MYKFPLFLLIIILILYFYSALIKNSNCITTLFKKVLKVLSGRILTSFVDGGEKNCYQARYLNFIYFTSGIFLDYYVFIVILSARKRL